jgi:hypothetical protein
MGKAQGKYDEAHCRWAGIGPYYAMFPTDFADQVIAKHTKAGDTVLDPFAGRGTAVFSAAIQGRCGVGVEINPLGWVYARAKLAPAEKELVAARFGQLGRSAHNYHEAAKKLPPFFHRCFTKRVREFLLAARQELNWKRTLVDCTAMALLLVNMHGKRAASLSNQLRQTKSMSPDYAIAWWKRRGLFPPDVDPVAFMKKKLDWRYAKGRPAKTTSRVYLGDSIVRLKDLARKLGPLAIAPARLLFTSPPYYAVTNYHYDQWLRLWLLGGPPNALRAGGAVCGKFEHRQKYRDLLHRVFSRAAELLSNDATVYVRADRREVTYTTTKDVLKEVFPDKRLRTEFKPFNRPTQTRLFGDHAVRDGDVDLILSTRRYSGAYL